MTALATSDPKSSGAFALLRDPELTLSCKSLQQGLPFWLFTGGFKVSSGTVYWYRRSYVTDFDKSEIASSVK